MNQLTKNIWRYELRCKGKNCDGQGNNCGFDSMDWETIEVVQTCCDHFAEILGMPRVRCRVHSAARCLEYNRSIGSTDESQHPKARAIDFSLRGVSPLDVYNYLVGAYPGKYGIGKYGTFTHLDTRTGPSARW